MAMIKISADILLSIMMAVYVVRRSAPRLSADKIKNVPPFLLIAFLRCTSPSFCHSTIYIIMLRTQQVFAANLRDYPRAMLSFIIFVEAPLFLT